MTKSIYAFLDIALVGIFGVTMFDMLLIISGGEHNLLTIDNAIKTLFSLAGVFYLIFIKIIGGIKINKLDRESKRLDNEAKKMANKEYRDNHTE